MKKVYAIIVLVLSFNSSVLAQDIEKSGYWGLNYYSYVEQSGGHDPFMQEKTKYLPTVLVGYQDFKGINSKDNKAFSYFVEGAYGQVEYSQYTGVGTHTHNYYKFQTEGLYPVVSNIYVGLGYRYLYDFLSDYGVGGYDRENQLIYAPVGYVQNLTNGSNIKYQYNYLIEGKQFSELSNVYGAGYDITNTQDKGWGLDISWTPQSKTSQWFVKYWDIADSDTVTVNPGGGALSGKEPQNQTLEIGFRQAF